MSAKTVNPYFLLTLINPLAGLGDVDSAVFRYADLDTNDEASVREVIRDLIVPYANEIKESRRDCVRAAYRYYLVKGGVDFERAFESILPPFDRPQDARRFFAWIWEECFPNEVLDTGDLDELAENIDVNETWQL